MKRRAIAIALLTVVACSSTPLGASRDAQRAYRDCVDLNGEASCRREKALAEKRRRELNDRDLNRRPTRDLDTY